MKKVFMLVFSVLCAACISAAAQDVITKRDGEDIMARIVEVTENAVKYKLESLPEGPLFSISKSEVLMVTYADGSREVFVDYADPYDAAPGLRPGMNYSELREYYDYRDYHSFYGYEQYSPPIMGICSFVIPGLGQIISGELGRGLAYFGGSLACYALSSISLISMLSSPAQGAMLAVASYAALIAVDVCSIVDAVRVAKVKNMYYSDLEKLSFDMELTPYVDVACTGIAAVQPVAGLSLRLSF